MKYKSFLVLLLLLLPTLAIAQGVGELEPRSSAATLVVAASDSTAKDKTNADYVCDGTDDHIQIQAALDALPAQGGSVLLLAGNYLAERIEIPSNTTFAGVGTATVLKMEDALEDRFITQDGWHGTNVTTIVSNIVIRDMQIDGNNRNQTNIGANVDAQGNAGCLDFKYTTGLTVRNCLIYQPWAVGIEVTHSTNVKVIGNTIRDYADDGIAINEETHYAIVSDNVIEDGVDTKTYGGSAAIEVQDGASFVTVTNNVIKFIDITMLNPSDGIAVGSHPDEDPCHHINITNNSIYTNQGEVSVMIKVRGEASDALAEHVIVSNNVMEDISTDTAVKIQIWNASNVTVMGNVGGSWGNWLMFQGTVSNIVVTGNKMTTLVTGLSCSIIASSTLNNVRISNNIISSQYTVFWLNANNITFNGFSVTDNDIFATDGSLWDFFLPGSDNNTYTDFEVSHNLFSNEDMTISNLAGNEAKVALWKISDNVGFSPQTVTFDAGANALNVIGESMTITGNGGGSSITSFVGSIEGQTLRLTFADALVTIADNPGTIDLSSDFISAAGVVLTLSYDGTSLYEVSRSDINNLVFLNVAGNVQLGDATTDIHGINTAPVANQMLTADFTDAGATSFFIDGTYANTGADSKTVRGYSIVLDISGTHDSSGIADSRGVFSQINDNTVYNSSIVLGNIYGVFGQTVFAGTNTDNGGLKHYGGFFKSSGDMGTNGASKHYGILGLAADTADVNYGGFFSASGATNNWAVYASAGNVYVADDLIANGQTGNTLQTPTLGAGVTTLAITKNVVTLTGHVDGNVLATITGGLAGQTITIICTDAKVTITDTDDAGGDNTIDLLGTATNFTSADGTVLVLLFDGTSSYEISRSVN